MVKLGKKARKFAKKHLQPVLKQRRKWKAMVKRKSSKRGQSDASEDQVEDISELSRNPEVIDIKDTSLDAVFSEDDSDADRDTSDSDGFLSEDSSCPSISDSDSEMYLEENSGDSALSAQNKAIQFQLEKEKKKLDKLKEKDPRFSKYLENYEKELGSQRNRDMDSDEDGPDEDAMQSLNGDGLNLNTVKILTSASIRSWIQLVSEQHNVPALAKLLNGYSVICNYGNRLTGALDTVKSRRIQNSEDICRLLMFILKEADSIFQVLLQVPSTNCKKGTFMELKKSPKWETMKPFIKSYLRSTLLLLSQVSDTEILAFSLTRLRASIRLFVAFPSLLRRLIKVSVNLWATGQKSLSLNSFLILRDIAITFRSDYFDNCLIKTYRAFMVSCNIVKPDNMEHLQFLRDSFVELCSLDVHKSISKAVVSIQKLARILQHGLQSKNKETLKCISGWQYAFCVDLWVVFLSANIKEYDLQPLLFIVIQIINGVVNLFPGPRYMPLRFKCVQWLNHLSSSSGVFIPVVPMILNILEYNAGKEIGSRKVNTNLSTNLKLPKHWLKSRNFQEDCALFAIELLSVHFAQWSFHISFPDMATIPLYWLRRFHENTAVESLRRVVKRFIDQVEQNVEYVQKKRDEVAYSPKDQQSVESFLQLEKCNSNASFTQYYKSIMNLATNGKKSLKNKKPERLRQESENTAVDASLIGKVKANVNGEIHRRKRQRKQENQTEVIS